MPLRSSIKEQFLNPSIKFCRYKPKDSRPPILSNSTELRMNEHVIKHGVAFGTDADNTGREWLLDNRDLIDNQLLTPLCTHMLGPSLWLKLDGAT